YVTIPGQPTEVHASEVFKSYIVLSWTPPRPRGRVPLSYVIEKRINTAVKLHSPRYPVFDLQDGLKYQFRVFSVNLYGCSEPSFSSEPVQRQDEDGVPSAPGQVVATRNSKSSVFVQWESPKHLKNLMGYYIDGRIVGSKEWFPCNHKPFKHCSEESQESTVIAVEPALATPSSASGISMLSCDGSSMTLVWKSPKHCGGSKVNAYYIDKRNADTLVWKEVNVAAVKERICTVDGLTEGVFYEFKVQAGNMAGVGVPSAPSSPMKCEAWTMEQPGPAYDMSFSEVRGQSLVVLWKAPVYIGASAVSGYLVEMAKKGSSEFVTLNEEAVCHRYLQVSGLQEGETYVFRVRSVNANGVGKPSQLSEPVCAKALPGTQEIVASVDEETGDVFLSLEACEISETSKFVWSKNYKAIGDCPRVAISNKGRTSKLTFSNPDKDDLGRYSAVVTDTDGVSSSHTLTEDATALNTMLELSYAIRHPSEVIVNDKEVTSGEVKHFGIKISHDVATGMIQMTVDHFTRASEGTYVVQIHDGKAKNQSSLVLVGDVFKAALKEAEFQRKEHIRKQGPHFSEYLSFSVTEDCTVLLACKVANVKKETSFHWYKEDDEIVPETPPNVLSGGCALAIPLFSRKDQGVYKAVLGDDRGKDSSSFDISGQVFDDITQRPRPERSLKCTPEGIRLQCYMNYYTEEMKTLLETQDFIEVSCLAVEESKIASSEKMRIGGTAEMAWMQIYDPSDKEKGKYSIEISDGVQTHSRTFDLSGQAYTDAYEEYLRLKSAAFAEKNRGRVVGGLPDVVTIMEEKSLSLTCTVWGEPAPEVSWFKNEQEVASNEHTRVTFEGGKFASMVINRVTPDDSGKYSINVRNKYGGEFVEITVSVYRLGEKIPEPKLGQPKTTAATPAPPPAPPSKTPTPTPKSQTPVSMKSPTPASTPASTPIPKSPTPSRGVKSPTPANTPASTPIPKSPTPSRSVKSPTPPRFMKSPTPPRK
ncbi:hypothetical protein KUCAC02_026915, partial [Chaenocephalus aceratus]